MQSMPQPHTRRLSLYLNICNTVFGTIGLVSAIFFGNITIVQANTANKQAEFSNKIAFTSMQLGWIQTCMQLVSIVSLFSVLLPCYVEK